MGLRLACCFLLMALFSFGCRSDYEIKAKAVDRAREYALERLGDWPEGDLQRIRFAPPYLLEQRLFAIEKEFSNKRDVLQTCVVWDYPEIDKSVVVSGVGIRRMDDWYPSRLLVKKFEEIDKSRLAAVNKARKYAISRMPYLENAEINRMRFTPPEILRTELIWEGVKVPEKLKTPTQFTLAWRADNPEQRLIVGGYGDCDMKKWRPVVCASIPVDELLPFGLKDAGGLDGPVEPMVKEDVEQERPR